MARSIQPNRVDIAHATNPGGYQRMIRGANREDINEAEELLLLAPDAVDSDGNVADWFAGLILGPGQPVPLVSPHAFNVYFNDFIKAADLDKTNDWVLSNENLATATGVITTDEQFGVVTIDAGATTDNHGGSLQLTGAGGAGEFVALTANKRIYFEARVKLNAATQIDALVGLGISDTTVLASAGTPSTTDFIGFIKDDGDTNWDFQSRKDSTETEETAIATASTSFVRLAMFIDGTTEAHCYVDGVFKKTISTNLPDNENLCITLAVTNGDGTTQQNIKCDYVYVVQER